MFNSIEEVLEQGIPTYHRRGLEIARMIREKVGELPPDRSPVYCNCDAGYGKSMAVRYLTVMYPNKQFIVCTDNTERFNDYFDFKEHPYLYKGRQFMLKRDEDFDAVVVVAENRIVGEDFVAKRKPHVVVLTTQFISKLDESEMKALAQGRVVIVDECYNNLAIHPLDIAANHKAKIGEDDVVPYEKLLMLNNDSFNIINAANNELKNMVNSTKSQIQGVFVPDNIRAAYGAVADMITNDDGLNVFRTLCKSIRDNKVIAATDSKKSKIQILIPRDLSFIVQYSSLFINLDATADYNSTKEILEYVRVEIPAQEVNLDVHHVNRAAGIQTLEEIDDWSDAFNWINDRNNCIIMPKKLVSKFHLVQKEIDGLYNDGKLGWWGASEKGCNNYREKSKMTIIGSGYIPPQYFAACTLWLMNRCGKDVDSYDELVNTNEYTTVAANHMAAKLIQATYRCSIRKHSGEHCDVWVMQKLGVKEFDLGWAMYKEYLTKRGARFTEDSLPFKLAEAKKYNTLTDWATKNSEAGVFAAWLVEHNLECTDAAIKLYKKDGGKFRNKKDTVKSLSGLSIK